MSNSDVQVIIEIQRPTPIVGMGKPLILGTSAAGQDYKVYRDLEAVKEDHATSSEVYKAAFALFNQGDNSPESIAVMLSKTGDVMADFLPTVFAKDFYYLLSTSSTLANITAIADAVEADDSRLFLASTSSLDDLGKIFANKYKRTAVLYHKNPDNYPEAAWVGRAGSAPPGSLTWKFKKLNGIVPLELTNSELSQLEGMNGNTYIVRAGDPITSEGKTISGEYIDIIQSQDYITQQITNKVQKLFNRSDKVSFDNNGIAQIEAEVKTVLKMADNNGMIAHDDDGLPIYSTAFKTRSQVDPLDREKREYNGGTFTFELAGAIHKTKIKGVIKL
ncbi:DUF3383 family protein [Paenibacillus sp. SAF-054]|uniref:DUF3383 family protein n=1 Tax=unclassified Paenibacillus TaxID=185978 RepID=UPI003F811B5E